MKSASRKGNISQLAFFAIAMLCALAVCGQTAAAAPQMPVMITFDLHADPMPKNLSVEDKRARIYLPWIENGNWLMDQVEPLGARVSFLSAGEFFEFCLEDEQRENTCFPLLRRFYKSGGIIGTHTHREIHAGLHEWPDLVGEPTPEEIARNWNDTKALVDRVIQEALCITDPAAIARINTARGSHLPESAQQHSMMESYGFTILEGGRDQELVKYFGHVPFSAYRPGDCTLCENLWATFVLPPQSMVIGKVGAHMNIWQDGSAARKQAEILQVLVNRRMQELAGGINKPWSYGWGVHLHDLYPNTASRQAITELIPWLTNNIVSRGLGNYASYIEARDRYADWESNHSGSSSFNYPYGTTDYNYYPYSRWANHYLRHARFASRLSASGADAFILRAGDYSVENSPTYPFVLTYSNGEPTNLDLSDVFGAATVRKTRLSDGQPSLFPSSSVPADPNPAVVCRPAECDAILMLERNL